MQTAGAMRARAAAPRRRTAAGASSAPPRGTSRAVVMRPLGEPAGAGAPPPPTSAAPPGSDGRFDAGSRSAGAPSTSYGGGGSGSNGTGTGLVLARQPVSALAAVQTAAAGGASSLRSRDRIAAAIAESSQRDFLGEADYKWAQDSYNVTQRNVDTWAFFVVFRTRLWLLDQKWSYAGGMTDEKRSARARGLAKYLLESILQLGPTFIKVGQLCSTRSDLFPAEFVEELGKLQDRVPAFSADKAEAIIEADLGQPVGKLFRSFDRRPIAAASLGQVHRAVLHSGEEVVVKVQRPGLAALFAIDLNNLRILAEQLDKGDDNRDFKGIYQECATVLYDEIEYIKEGRNADKFRRNFRDTPWVRTPTVHWAFSSPRVLTLEYLPGVKITDAARLQAAGIATDLVARRATEAYLMQVLRHGFFHADPHPGNVSVDAAGRLLFYDYGMMGTIPGNVRERLLDVFYGIYKKDAGGVVRALVELGVITPTGDMLSVRRAIAYFIDNITRQTERQETIAAIGEDLFAVALDQPFRFPATFTFVLRAFSTLEGIGKTLNPAYNFSEVATPYAQELLALQEGGQQGFIIEQLQQQATEVTQAAAAMPLRVARIDSTLEQLETGDLKLRVATINTVATVGLLNVGTQLALHGGLEAGAGACFALAGLSAVFVALGFKRVQRLDKFEKEIRG
ncbi:ABC1K7 [Scenedesmus sp. PABB004]|nr:ABC1K7 [Scenedesmus sp. PABB004]